MWGNCQGTHNSGYDYYSNITPGAIIDVEYARAWVCDVLAANQNPPATPDGAVTRYAWSRWSNANSCKWQADLYTRFIKPGVINQVSYTNIDAWPQ